MTPEQTKVMDRVCQMLKSAFPSRQGWFKFHLARKKPNADQVDYEQHIRGKE